MRPEKWEDIKGKIKETFKDVEFEKSTLPEPQKGKVETALFTGPLGQMRMEFITKPVMLDKVTHGSRRIGSETAVDYVYSEDEFIHQLKAYLWDDMEDGWVEMETEKGVFNL